jgi:mannonate dehydratase
MNPKITPKITDVQVFLTQPQGPEARLAVVRVRTDAAGIEGLGCATFTQRHRAVEAAIVHHLRPFLLGKDPRQIEDLWHGMMFGGYWRNGPVLNSAIGGIDMALWDIKGKLAGMPCYELWGGKCRESVTVYCHATAATPQDVAQKAKGFLDHGVRHVRCQLTEFAETLNPGKPSDSRARLHAIPLLFAHLRNALGPNVELIYDIHERLDPPDAVALARALEPYGLFFLEDAVAPEQLEWLSHLRQHSPIPLAIGELFNNPHEILPFVGRRLFDFLRVHPSQLGGVTPCLKLAHVCAAFGIRTAWHGPADLSPIGVAANIHMDLALHNFGIQEWSRPSKLTDAMFPGSLLLDEGIVRANDKPGWGVDFDEELAAKTPCIDADVDWTTARRPDGTICPP